VEDDLILGREGIQLPSQPVQVVVDDPCAFVRGSFEYRVLREMSYPAVEAFFVTGAAPDAEGAVSDGAAAATDGVQECSVLYDYAKETICLFYSGTASTRDVAVGMRKTLPGFMIPRKMQRLDAVPKLPNGKTDLSALKQML
jgi:hypothetical protein